MASPEKRGNGPFPWSVKYRIGTNPETNEPIYKRDSGFATRDDALDHGREQEADIRRGLWHDARRGEITLDDYFWKKWLPAQDYSDKSRRNRIGEYRTHIAPRWGTGTLNDIDTFDVMAFEGHMRTVCGRSQAGNVLDLLRFMLDDAAHAELIKKSPMLPRQRQRGNGAKGTAKTRVGMLTTIDEMLQVGDRLKPCDALMALTALFTGMRWAEVSGMRRAWLDVGSVHAPSAEPAVYVIDEKTGAVHEEQSGRRDFGPPKGGKGRRVELPLFLARMLAAHLETIPAERELLFVNSRAQAHNHSSFINNHWRPACDGWPAREGWRGRFKRDAAAAVHEGLWFHDLRHTHKTWLAEDGIEPVARDERLGHVTPGMDGVYVHPTPAMRARILAALAARWDAAGAPRPNWSPEVGE